MPLQLFRGYHLIHLALLAMVYMVFYLQRVLGFMGFSSVIIALLACLVLLLGYRPDSQRRPGRISLFGLGKCHFTFVLIFFLLTFAVSMEAMVIKSGITPEIAQASPGIFTPYFFGGCIISLLITLIFMLNFTPKMTV